VAGGAGEGGRRAAAAGSQLSAVPLGAWTAVKTVRTLHLVQLQGCLRQLQLQQRCIAARAPADTCTLHALGGSGLRHGGAWPGGRLPLAAAPRAPRGR
jgi:hypothetical protein